MSASEVQSWPCSSYFTDAAFALCFWSAVPFTGGCICSTTNISQGHNQYHIVQCMLATQTTGWHGYLINCLSTPADHVFSTSIYIQIDINRQLLWNATTSTITSAHNLWTMHMLSSDWCILNTEHYAAKYYDEQVAHRLQSPSLVCSLSYNCFFIALVYSSSECLQAFEVTTAATKPAIVWQQGLRLPCCQCRLWASELSLEGLWGCLHKDMSCCEIAACKVQFGHWLRKYPF